MKIHVASDFHLEFTPGWTYTPPQGADINLIAGDTYPGEMAIQHLNNMGFAGPVLTVAGNHEFYHKVYGTALAKLRDAGERGGAYLLENSSMVWRQKRGAVTFLGATLWTDFQYRGDAARSMRAAQQMMGDYSIIWNDRTNARMTPTDTQIIHKNTVAWLDEMMSVYSGTNKKIVVMTHHAPSPKSISPQYKGSPLNAAFVSDLEWLMKKHSPVLWVHGHVHSSHDYMVGDTRVVANPRGYPLKDGTFENPNFNPNLIVEI